MKSYVESLQKCVLFKNTEANEIDNILKNVPNTLKQFNSGDIIAIEGDSCDNVGVILDGNIEIHKSFASGRIVTINHFEGGNIFGEALVFSGEHKYPANIISTTSSSIMFISRSDIVKLMTLDDRILTNFMGVLSNRILMLNQRLSNLTLDTLRKKIADVFLKEHEKQETNHITLPYSRRKMAEMLNIPRPSLSRELINMTEDGLIEFNKNKVFIKDLKGLKDIFL